MEQSPPFSVPYTIGNYLLTDVIGSGAFSVVYKAEHTSTKEVSAIKVIPKRLLTDEKEKEQFQRELDAMAYLKHDNIVSMRDFFSDEDHFFISLDYCPGGTLIDVLCAAQSFRESAIATMFSQIVQAVQYCHSHDVAHRDLKPQNILITTFPNIKIADFGLCGYIIGDKMQTFCGSPCYTAPECLSRTKYDGKCADVWSLGVILFEMATFEHPWPIQNTSKMVQLIQKGQYVVPSTVTPALADLIKQMMRVNPKERPSCEKILGHPWMRLAGSKSRESSLPPLKGAHMSLPLLTASLDRKTEEKDSGIINPLSVKMQNVPGLGAAPRTQARTRSGSVGNRTMRQSLGASQPIILPGMKKEGRQSSRVIPPLPPRRL